MTIGSQRIPVRFKMCGHSRSSEDLNSRELDCLELDRRGSGFYMERFFT